jgi:hypothetical protein
MGRQTEEEQESGASYDKHPALRNFNRTGFMVKHVLKGVLKWGAIGAVAAVAAAAAATLFASYALVTSGVGAIVGVLAAVFSGLSSDFASGLGSIGKDFALSTAMYSAAGGGIIGAAIGGIVSISNVTEAANAEEDRLVAKYEQQEARKDRMIALERRRDEQKFAMERQSESMRGGPGVQVPRGKHGHGAGHAHA